MPVAPVKSVPGWWVTMAPSVIGSPVAFCPVPRPHLETVLPLLVVGFERVALAPQPATRNARLSVRASSQSDGWRLESHVAFTGAPFRPKKSGSAPGRTYIVHL